MWISTEYEQQMCRSIFTVIMIHTCDHLVLQVDHVFGVLLADMKLAAACHVDFLKLAPSPPSDLCFVKNSTRSFSSSTVQWARSEVEVDKARLVVGTAGGPIGKTEVKCAVDRVDGMEEIANSRVELVAASPNEL
jgi:hypothetical protein